MGADHFNRELGDDGPEPLPVAAALVREHHPAPTLVLDTAKVEAPAMQEPMEKLLADLKGAIKACEEGSDNHAELARLAGEVERRLGDRDDEGLVDELRGEVTRFEVSHPALAHAIGRAADALSAIGL